MDGADDNSLPLSPPRTPPTPDDSAFISLLSTEIGEERTDEEVHSSQSQPVEVQSKQAEVKEEAVEVQRESVKEEAVEVQPESVKEEAVEVLPRPKKSRKSSPSEKSSWKSRRSPSPEKSSKRSPKRINMPRGFTSSALPPKGARRSYGKASCLSVASADQGGVFFFDHVPPKDVRRHSYFLIDEPKSNVKGIITTTQNTCLDFQSLVGCVSQWSNRYHTCLAAIVSCLPNSAHGPPVVLGMLSSSLFSHQMLEKQRFKWSKAELAANQHNLMEKERKLEKTMKRMEDDNATLLRITANKARFDSLNAQHQVAQQYKVQQNQLLHQLVQPAPIVLQPQQLLGYVPHSKPHHVSDASDSSSESDEGVKRAMERAMEAYKKKRLARKQAKKESRKEVKKSKKRRRSRSSTPDERELRRSKYVSD